MKQTSEIRLDTLNGMATTVPLAVESDSDKPEIVTLRVGDQVFTVKMKDLNAALGIALLNGQLVNGPGLPFGQAVAMRGIRPMGPIDGGPIG